MVEEIRAQQVNRARPVTGKGFALGVASVVLRLALAQIVCNLLIAATGMGLLNVLFYLYAVMTLALFMRRTVASSAYTLKQETLVEAVRAPHRHIARHDGLVGGAIAQALRHRSHRVAPLSARHRPVPERQRFRHARGGPRLGQGFVNRCQRIRGVPDARRDRPAGPGLVDESQRGHEGDRAGGGAEREGRKKNGGRSAVDRGRGRGGLPRAAHVGDRTRGRGLERERPSQADHLAALTQPRGAPRSGKQGRQ